MKPINFVGATHIFGAPEGWDEDRDGPCEGLPLSIEGNVYSSAWKPTPEDLILLNSGGSVCLHLYGLQPPAMLTVEFIEEKTTP